MQIRVYYFLKSLMYLKGRNVYTNFSVFVIDKKKGIQYYTINN